MNFYRISISEFAPNRFAWAGGFGPTNCMPFVESFSEEQQNSFLDFWKLNRSIPGIEIDRGGKEWSDVLGCGGGPPGVFFSERTIDDLRTGEITFFRCTEMPIGKIHSGRLKEITPPRYYVLEAAPGMKIRSESVPIEVQIAARDERPPRWISPVRTFGKLDTWNGSDLFSPFHGKSLTALFCTEKVKALAEQKGWTNVNFMPIEIE
jgi:hypothetical protein